MSRKNRRIKRFRVSVLPKRVDLLGDGSFCPVVASPVSVTPPSFRPRFTPHATKVAEALGMSREQLANLMESGNELHILQVLDKSFQPCGECQLCCEVMSIAALNKPNYQKCPKQCATGCSIHGQHPEECQTYACFWKTRFIDNGLEFRPDKFGAIFDMDKIRGKEVLRVWQTVPDMVLNNPEVRRITTELANQFNIPVFAYYKDDFRSIFLVSGLSPWRPAFEKEYPNYPVYDLPTV